jgi:dihydrofolate reductase
LQQFAVSVDGYICEEGTEFHRLWQTVEDDEFDRFFVAQLHRAGTHLMGRDTYLAMADYWPKAAHGSNAAEVEIAGIMNDRPKVVFGHGLSLFGELERPQALRLVSSRPFRCGAIEVIYERSQEAVAALSNKMVQPG